MTKATTEYSREGRLPVRVDIELDLAADAIGDATCGPDGLGSSSGELGHNLMDHHFRCGAEGIVDEHRTSRLYGRRPTGFYIPRYRNFFGDKRRVPARLRLPGQREPAGMGARASRSSASAPRSRTRWRRPVPGEWARRRSGRCCRTTPTGSRRRDEDRQVGSARALHRLRNRRERTAHAARHDERHGRDARGRRRQATCAFTTTATSPAWASTRWAPRAWGAIRRRRFSTRTTRCGTAPNVFVTDGSCMVSSGCQNPSLTYMALTARAAAFAVDELKKGNL